MTDSSAKVEKSTKRLMSIITVASPDLSKCQLAAIKSNVVKNLQNSFISNLGKIKMAIVSPAYGRDYETGADATKDWFDGKDFISKDVLTMGRHCSTRDFGPDEIMEIRYNRLRDLAMVENSEEVK